MSPHGGAKCLGSFLFKNASVLTHPLSPSLMEGQSINASITVSHVLQSCLLDQIFGHDKKYKQHKGNNLIL